MDVVVMTHVSMKFSTKQFVAVTDTEKISLVSQQIYKLVVFFYIHTEKVGVSTTCFLSGETYDDTAARLGESP
jgi:hypothetical protein